MTQPTNPQIDLTTDMPSGGYPAGTTKLNVSLKVTSGQPSGATTVTVIATDKVTGAQDSDAITLTVKSPVKPMLIGATLSTMAWPTGTTLTKCYQDWAAEFGMPGAAKVYLQPGQFPTKLTGTLQVLHDLGIVPIVCFGGMNWTDLNAERTAFRSCISALTQAFPTGFFVIDQEPNNGLHIRTAGWGAQPFIALSHARYADVKAVSNWPVLYCPASGGGAQPVQDWYPGAAGCDGIAPDHYCGPHGNWAPPFQLAAQLATRDKLPAGVGWLELGCNAAKSAAPTPDVLTSLINGGIDFFKGLGEAGTPRAPWCWWNGPMAGMPPQNAIWPANANHANSYIVPLWKNVIAQLAG